MTDYYVDSVGGSDSNTGTSESAPFQTFEVINTLAGTPAYFNGGDRILIKRGSTFVGNQILTLIAQNSSVTVPIVVRPYGAGPMPLFNGLDTGSFPIFGGGGAISIEEMECKNYAGSENAGIYWDDAASGNHPSVWIRNNVIHSIKGDGIALLSGTSASNTNTRVIAGNTVYDIANDGISTFGNVSAVLVLNNTIYNVGQLGSGTYRRLNQTSGDGITAHAGASGLICRGNHIYNCIDGINVINSGTSITNVIERNWIHDCNEHVIWITHTSNETSASTWQVRNNLLCLSASMANAAAATGVTYDGAVTIAGLMLGWPNNDFAVTKTDLVHAFHVTNNTFYNAHATAPSLWAYAKSSGSTNSTLTVRNNVFKHTGLAPYLQVLGRTRFQTTPTVNYNNYSGDLTAGWQEALVTTLTPYATLAAWRLVAGWTHDLNAVSGDPLLVGVPTTSVDNGRLGASSPAIGIGTDLSGTFTDDFEGRIRPSGSAWDAGAFHRWAGTSVPTVVGGRLLGGIGR